MSRFARRDEQPDLIAAVRGFRSGARSGSSSAVDHGYDHRTTTFLRGLTLGAIVGAAIAGSTIWSRWRRDRAGSATDPSGSRPEDGLG